MNKLNVQFKILVKKNKYCNTPSIKKSIYQTFYRNQIHYNYKLQKKYFKNVDSKKHNPPRILMKK